jgi:hypothetical protein
MKIRNQSNQCGTAIVLVISIMATLMVIVGVAAEYTTSIHRNVARSNTLGSAIAVADGVIEHNFAHWRKTAQTPGYPTPTTDDLLDNIPLPTQAQFPGVKNFTATQNNYNNNSNTTVQQCRVVALDPQHKQIPDDYDPPTKQIGQGADSVIYNYRATAYVTLPALRGKVVAKVQRIFQKEQLSPWNWAIFYNDPLEIHPGPEFHVTGWVHTNSDLYTGNNTLYFEDKVTYGGDWSIGYMPGDGQHPAPPQPPNYPSNLPPALDANGQEPFDVAASAFNPTDSNPNNDSYRELIEPADPSSSDPLDGKRYIDQASVIIEIDANNNVTLKNNAGTVLNSSSTGTNKQLYDMFKDAVTTNQTIQDNREQKPVRLATLDIDKMLKKQPITGVPTGEYETNKFNGVVYIRDTSAVLVKSKVAPNEPYNRDTNPYGTLNPDGTIDPNKKRGIRIKNGAYIPDGGITVASANPVYIEGDFNTGGTGVSVPSNLPGSYADPDNPPQPQALGYTRQPCSVIADAVNVFSNSWLDAESTLGVGARVANNTTVNAAIVSGNVPSGIDGNNYSGGAENFPRFHETWSLATLTYYGSMVQLYQSHQSDGTWGKANVYSPPKRQWYFDTNFRRDTPPGSLMVYKYNKGRWALAP